MCQGLLISVIIPCYNLGEFLKPCLDSIARQERGSVEYIFVNDGSTDNTLAQIKEFCEGRPDTILLTQENKGVCEARNLALQHCKGQYIYLLDGDDTLAENSVGLMKEAIQSSKADIIMTPVVILQGQMPKLIPLNLKSGIYTPEGLYESCSWFPTRPQLLYRSQIIKENGLIFNPGIQVGEVYDFTVKYLAKATSVYVVHSPLFNYVMRPSSATHKPNYKKDLTVLKAVDSYYSAGERFATLSSFNVTAFKMLMSFTYNKYVRSGERSPEAVNAVKDVLSDKNAAECIHKVATSGKSPLKERLLALYVTTTGIKGFKILTRLFGK